MSSTRRYDDLRNYSNDRSVYLAQLRDSIEEPWQAWELAQLSTPVSEYKDLTPQQVGFQHPTYLLICHITSPDFRYQEAVAGLGGPTAATACVRASAARLGPRDTNCFQCIVKCTSSSWVTSIQPMEQLPPLAASCQRSLAEQASS